MYDAAGTGSQLGVTTHSRTTDDTCSPVTAGHHHHHHHHHHDQWLQYEIFWLVPLGYLCYLTSKKTYFKKLEWLHWKSRQFLHYFKRLRIDASEEVWVWVAAMLYHGQPLDYAPDMEGSCSTLLRRARYVSSRYLKSDYQCYSFSSLTFLCTSEPQKHQFVKHIDEF